MSSKRMHPAGLIQDWHRGMGFCRSGPDGATSSPALSPHFTSSGFISFTCRQVLTLLVTSTSILNPNQCSNSPSTSQCLTDGFL